MNTTINNFLNQLESDAVIPAGGSVTNITGAMISCLFLMIINIHKSKKSYQSQVSRLDALAVNFLKIKKTFCDLKTKDEDALNDLIKNNTNTDILKRTQKAMDVAIETIDNCHLLMKNLKDSIDLNFKNMISDIGVILELCLAVALASKYTALINLRNHPDEKLKSEIKNSLELKLENISKDAAIIRQKIEESLSIN